MLAPFASQPSQPQPQQQQQRGRRASRERTAASSGLRSFLKTRRPSATPSPDRLALPPSYERSALSSSSSFSASSGFLARCGDPSSSSSTAHWPPPMRSAVAALDPRKASVSVLLAQETVFVRPPLGRVGRWEDEAWDVEPRSDAGPTLLHGILAVVSPDRRTVDDVRLSLTAHQTLALRRDEGLTGPPEEFDLARWDVSLAELNGGERVELVKGVNCFAFEFLLPSTSPPSVSSSYGRLRYVLHARVPGAGTLFKGKLAARKEVSVVLLPHVREGETVKGLAVKKRTEPDWAGPMTVEINAERTILSAPLVLKLTLRTPPPTLVILGVRAYLAQTVTLRGSRGQEQTVHSPRRLVLHEGRTHGWRPSGQEEDWIAGSAPPAESRVFDGAAWAAAHPAGREWTLTKAGTIPLDSTIRPTTAAAGAAGLPPPGLGFASELVVEALVSSRAGGALETALLWRGAVELASEHCNAATLDLPVYTA